MPGAVQQVTMHEPPEAFSDVPSTPPSEAARTQVAAVQQTSTMSPTKGIFRSAPIQQAMGTYLPATVVFRLINLGRILLLSWWMTLQQFGLLNMLLLIVNVLTPFCSFGLNEAVARYVPQHETRGTLRSFLRISLVLLLGVTFLSTAMLISFSPLLGDFFYAHIFEDPSVRQTFHKDAAGLASITAVVIALLIVYFYLLAVLKGLRMFTALSLVEIVHGVLFLLFAVVAYGTDMLSALTLISFYGLSLAVPILLFGAGLLRALRRWPGQTGSTADTGLMGTLLRFSFWTAVAGLVWQVLVYYPAWHLNRYYGGNEAVAVFSAVRQIGQFILVGAVAVTAVVTASVAKTWESRGPEAADRQWSLAFRATGLGLLMACTLITLARFQLIRMFPSKYADGAEVLPLQLAFFLLGAYLAFLSVQFQLIEKTRLLLWPWVAGVVVNLLLAFQLNDRQRLPSLQETPVWRSLSGATVAIFSTGFSDPQGLGGAAWCGVFGIAAALGLCVILLRAERRRLDRGSWIILVAALLLCLRAWLLATGTLALLCLVFFTSVIFSDEERRQIKTHAFAILRHVPTFRLRRHTGDGT